MKKLILTLLLLAATQFAHADRFGGVWKHHYANVEGHSVRLSFKESRVVPNIGQPNGGRIAREIYIDVWGDLGYKTIDYRFLTDDDTAFEGTLIKDQHNHQYARLSRYSDDYIWLQGNQDYKHAIEIVIDGRAHSINLNL